MRRELAQLAAQRSTYIVRGIYASVTALVGAVVFYGILDSYTWRGNGTYGAAYMYGVGSQLLSGVGTMALISIVVVLPAMVVGSVTSEREQGTLDLMRISRLSPWDIVLQKYFARIVPFCTFLLLLVPLGAVAYSLGGVSVGDVLAAVITLLSAVLRVAAIALLCSAICRSTLSAFLAAYLSLLLLFVGVPFLWVAWLGHIFRMIDSDWILVWVFGPCLQQSPTSGEALLYGALLLAGLYVTLTATRLFLARPRLQRGAVIKRLHLRYDRLVEWVNRFVGNVRWGGREASLPDGTPVAWRERSRAAVCMPRHMFRLFSLVCIPAGTLLVLLAASSGIFFCSGEGCYRHGREVGELALFILFLWLPAILVPAVYVANLISGERTDQTLDVLLTTPIEPRDILRQKMAAVPRLVLLVTAPIIMTIVVEFVGKYVRHGELGKGMLYLMLALGSIVVYEWLFVWVAMSCSLRSRRRAVVVMQTLLRILGLIVVPFLLMLLYGLVFGGGAFEHESMLFTSPTGLFILTELAGLDEAAHIAAGIVGLLAYGVIGWFTCLHCFSRASQLLHRTPQR
ncbi:MAG: ABC transporter permease [Lentisphaerae bacterium]|nr:ABC transporter permease [Lentisphaerota bacterium]